MEKKKGMQALDDDALEAVTGGVNNDQKYKIVSLCNYSIDDLNYYLQNQCPNPNCRKTLTKKDGGNYGCDSCMLIYIQ